MIEFHLFTDNLPIFIQNNKINNVTLYPPFLQNQVVWNQNHMHQQAIQHKKPVKTKQFYIVNK